MAALRKSHKDVEFMVGDGYYRRFENAASMAVSRAASDGRTHNIDVLVYSRSGARWWGGDDAVLEYEEDPEASVFERIEIKADSVGRIP